MATEAQINEVLAELGLRTPGQPLPPEPERIVAEALVDSRARVKELVGEVLETGTKLERMTNERDRLAPFEGQALDLQTQLDRAEAAAAGMLDQVDHWKFERDKAFAYARGLEVQVRTLSAQVNAAPLPTPPGQGNGQGQGGGKP